MSESGAWTTSDEINYLKKSGTHSDAQEPTVRQALEGYLKAVQNRSNWGAMDAKKVIDFAEKKLAEL